MTVEGRRQSLLDGEHGPETTTEHKRLSRLATTFYGALTAHLEAGHSPPACDPSLDTREQLYKADAAPGFSDGSLSEGDLAKTIDDLEHVSDAAEVLHGLVSVPGERHETTVELVLQGEVAHAKRYANCRQQSIQLKCSDEAFWEDGCGENDIFVPTHCDSRLCDHCMNRRMGRVIKKYLPAVENWDQPTLLTLTIENVDDPVTGKEAVQGAYGRLRRRTIPPVGETVRDGARKRWVWGHDGGEPATSHWKRALRAGGNHDLARGLQKRYVEQDRNIPLDELLRASLYGIDIKQQSSGEFNVHLHALCDMAYVPQEALSSVWEDLTGAPVVDVRRAGERGGQDRESALAEVVGYVAKPPEYETVTDEVEYLRALKGARLIGTTGELHQNAPELPSLLRCPSCERARYLRYVGLVDHPHDHALVVGDGPDGDRPPPD